MTKKQTGWLIIGLVAAAVVAGFMGKNDVAVACAWGAVMVWLMLT